MSRIDNNSVLKKCVHKFVDRCFYEQTMLTGTIFFIFNKDKDGGIHINGGSSGDVDWTDVMVACDELKEILQKKFGQPCPNS